MCNKEVHLLVIRISVFSTHFVLKLAPKLFLKRKGQVAFLYNALRKAMSVLILSVLMVGKIKKEDQIPVDNGYYSISWCSSSDSRQQRILRGDTWNNAVFKLRIMLDNDTAGATVGNREYWEEILGIMQCLNCALCYIMTQQERQ